jgi:hypothetical protein
MAGLLRRYFTTVQGTVIKWILSHLAAVRNPAGIHKMGGPICSLPIGWNVMDEGEDADRGRYMAV